MKTHARGLAAVQLTFRRLLENRNTKKKNARGKDINTKIK